jgi:hypothetical protein
MLHASMFQCLFYLVLPQLLLVASQAVTGKFCSNGDIEYHLNQRRLDFSKQSHSGEWNKHLLYIGHTRLWLANRHISNISSPVQRYSARKP